MLREGPKCQGPAVARRLIQPRLVTDLPSPPQCPDAFVELITKPVDTGWGRSERFRAPTPLPFPLPARWKRVLPMVTDVRGEGANVLATDTRGGGRCAPLPRATILWPCQGGKRLTIRFSGTPCPAEKKLDQFLRIEQPTLSFAGTSIAGSKILVRKPTGFFSD